MKRIHWLVGRKVTAHNSRGDGKHTGVVLKVEREEGRGLCATLSTGHSIHIMDVLDTEPLPEFYVSTYCNFAHNMRTGRPIGHECRHIPLAALRLEREGFTGEAIEIIAASRK